MCCTGPAWKREVVQDHKFDFVDTRDFHTKSFGVRVQYMWIYILVLKSFLVYLSDIYTAATMLTSTTWTNTIYNRCPANECPTISFSVGKWIFVGCIIFSFLLLAYEAQKSKKIIASRDISYAFTNIMANNYYSLRSYNHFCFFSQIENSTKKKDDFAFFIFFTFKEWKRVLLADGARQCINGLTLYSFWVANGRGNPFNKISSYYDGDYVTAGLLVTMIFTCLIFIGSLLLLLVAGILYIPLLCYIRGNLKEYCCHKVDKRIAELLKKKAQQRVLRQAALAKKEAAGDFGHLKGKKGAVPVSLPQQPTLPSVAIDDVLEMKDNQYSRQQQDAYWDPDHKSDYNGSVYQGGGGGGASEYDYPPMPSYHQGSVYSNGDPHAGDYAYENDMGYAGPPGEDPYSSTAHLTYGAAPPAGYYQEQNGQYYAEDQYQYQQHGLPPGAAPGYAM
ncbi:hypothetical protein FRB96_000231 [Tulasnella sp. 330]|nr:hypothetical protein FRB96_000231 [Tulasnella sp. 330]KAG8886503.1 hypothetical protein FRB97_003014 [Tulasnella sp. 331]KAG8889761.1 hypothetical protein FRB98_002683 [Tulasnella sp. 332]